MTITPTLITPPASPTFSAWKVDFDNPSDAMTAMIVGAQLGYQTNALCQGTIESPVWQISFVQPRVEPQIAHEHDWIVSDGEAITCYTPSDFAARFTADVPLVWSATPVAVGLTGATASITVPVPTSPTAPWTWAVTITGAGAATLAGTPTIDGGVVTIGVRGLTVGADLSFEVAVTDHYDQTATSAESNAVTVVG